MTLDEVLEPLKHPTILPPKEKHKREVFITEEEMERYCEEQEVEDD